MRYCVTAKANKKKKNISIVSLIVTHTRQFHGDNFTLITRIIIISNALLHLQNFHRNSTVSIKVLLSNAPVICIQGSPRAGVSGDKAGLKCQVLTLARPGSAGDMPGF